MIARARNTDPSPSHQAAATVNESCKAARQRDKVLAELKRLRRNTGPRLRPGHTPYPPTAAELAKWARMDRYMVCRRLPEMRGGDVENGEDRICNVLGSPCQTWRITT